MAPPHKTMDGGVQDGGLSVLPAASDIVAGAATAAESGLWEVAAKADLPKLSFGMSISRNLPLVQSGSRRFRVAQASLEGPQSLVSSWAGCKLDERWRTGRSRLPSASA